MSWSVNIFQLENECIQSWLPRKCQVLLWLTLEIYLSFVIPHSPANYKDNCDISRRVELWRLFSVANVIMILV